MVKLVIFDWDGTLFDSLDRICFSLLSAAEAAEAPSRQKEQVKNIIGLSLEKGVSLVWPELSPHEHDQIIEQYRRIYTVADHSPPRAYDGVINTLNKLKQANVKMAVATGKRRKGLDRVMSLTGTADYFAASRCADEALSKPHPLMLEQILAKLNLSAEQAIMVGDTEYDLNMATNAGMRSIGVTYGAHSKARLAACHPHAILDDFNQLLNTLGLNS